MNAKLKDFIQNPANYQTRDGKEVEFDSHNPKAKREKVIVWSIKKNLCDPVKQTLKTLSEAGELADAICKADLSNKVATEEIIDAIGDIEVCLTILKNQLNLRQDYPLEEAWEVIKDRKGKTVNGTFVKE